MKKLEIHSLKNDNTIDQDAKTTVKRDIDLKEIKVNIPEKEKLNDKYFSESDLRYYDIILENEPVNNIVLNFKNSYKLGKLLGEGAYGKVYECLDTSLGQVMAVKVFDIGKLSNKVIEEKLDSFIAESKMLSKLNHKNTVKFFGVQKTSQSFNIFLELVIGGSLSKIINTYGRLPEKLVKKYTLEILYGLEYLHMHNVIHRDIKGANILVDRDGTCKLSDFGGAKEIIEEFEFEVQNSLKGTPNWMAPECVKNMEYSRYSDIWSLGCTIIEMMSGKPPFNQFKTQMAALYNIMNVRESPTLPEGIKASDECKDFLSKCLAIEPRERWNVRKLLHHSFITSISDNNNKIDNKKEVVKNEVQLRSLKESSNRNSKNMIDQHNDFNIKNEIIDNKEISIVKNNEEYYNENDNDNEKQNKFNSDIGKNGEYYNNERHDIRDIQNDSADSIDEIHEKNEINTLDKNKENENPHHYESKNENYYIEEESKSDKFKNNVTNNGIHNTNIHIEEPKNEEVNGDDKTKMSHKVNPINHVKNKIVIKTKEIERKNIIIKRKKKD